MVKGSSGFGWLGDSWYHWSASFIPAHDRLFIESLPGPCIVRGQQLRESRASGEVTWEERRMCEVAV